MRPALKTTVILRTGDTGDAATSWKPFRLAHDEYAHAGLSASMRGAHALQLE